MEKLPIIRRGRTLATIAEECKFNGRHKLYPDGQGGWFVAQTMVSKYHIFNPHNVEIAWQPIKIFKCHDELFRSEEEIQAENRDRAIRRAKGKLYDLIRCNLDLCFFLTLTLSAESIDRSNYSDVIKKFSQWADNAVRRKGFKYVGVVERHKKSNGLHFHLVVNDALNFVDSGTVKCKGFKKPIKISTADRYKVPAENRQTVFNCADWKKGFSTAIQIVGDDFRVKVAHYLVKYLTKDFEKIGGRYYYSGGELLKPIFSYANIGFNDFESTYEFDVEGNSFKVLNHDVDNG